MINAGLVLSILNEIDALELEYQQSQGMILTEDDLKCHLFARLKAILPTQMPTINKHVNGSALHSEVKFFDENGKLTLRPDITIISPENLSIFHSVEFAIDNNRFDGFKKYSSKSFEICGNAIIIELKFCRDQNGLSDNDILAYQKDVNKIIHLQELIRNRSNGRDKLLGICAVFNKTAKGKEKFDEFQLRNNSHSDINVVYKSGNVDFTDIQVTMYGFVPKRYNVG